MINEAQIQEFKSKLRGKLFDRNDPEYDKARAVYNGISDTLHSRRSQGEESPGRRRLSLG